MKKFIVLYPAETIAPGRHDIFNDKGEKTGTQLVGGTEPMHQVNYKFDETTEYTPVHIVECESINDVFDIMNFHRIPNLRSMSAGDAIITQNSELFMLESFGMKQLSTERYEIVRDSILEDINTLQAVMDRIADTKSIEEDGSILFS